MSDDAIQANNLHNIEEKLDLIRKNRKHGGHGYTVAVKESAALIELALKEMIRRYLHQLKDPAYLKFNEKQNEIGKGSKTYRSFTMGQLVGLIRESRFLDALAEATGLNLTRIRMINLDQIVKLRNDAVHDDYCSTAAEAEMLWIALRAFVEGLGVIVLDEGQARQEQGEQASALSGDFDPAATGEDGGSALAPADLPHLPNRFCGRTSEIVDLVSRLQPMSGPRTAQLITLTGPGGAGKTSLAIEIGHRLRHAYADRAYFVSLVDATDAADVMEKIAEVLLLRRDPRSGLIEQLARQIGTSPVLLILDNFEHLADVGADVIREMRQRLAAVTLLVTSRQSLHLEREQTVPLPPLPVPEAVEELSALQECASVQLFVDCAAHARPDFLLTEENAGLVAAICRRLEGFPLSLKLAAAWVNDLALKQIDARLAERFSLLVSQNRDTPVRQRSLHIALDTSYALLTPSQQQVLLRLSVFRGGWTVEAAEAVCPDEEPADEQADAFGPFVVLAALRELHTRSLVTAQEVNGAMRYRMLETIRDFVAKRLQAAEHTRLEQRHSDYFGQLAQQARSHFGAAGEDLWIAQVDMERANLYAAMEAALRLDQQQVARDLSNCLGYFWFARGLFDEGRARIARLLPLVAHPGIKARLLNTLGALAERQGDYDEAEIAFRSCLEQAETAGDNGAQINALGNLGLLAWNRQDYAAARAYHEQCLPLDLLSGVPHNILITRLNLAQVACREGNFVEARHLLNLNVEQARTHQDTHGLAWSLGNLGNLARLEGNLEQAQNLCRESLTLLNKIDDELGMATVIEELAYTLQQQGRAEECLRLLGTANATRRKYGSPMTPPDQIHYDVALTAARQQLSDDLIETLLAEGRARSLSDAVAETLNSR